MEDDDNEIQVSVDVLNNESRVDMSTSQRSQSRSTASPLSANEDAEVV